MNGHDGPTRDCIQCRRREAPSIHIPAGHHTWAELLRLVGAVRRLAFERSLDDADRARRIRDRFGEYDGMFDDDC